MKKILFLIEFLPFGNIMSSVRINEIMKYLIVRNWEVFSFSILNKHFFKNSFYEKKVNKFKFFVCVGRNYKDNDFILKKFLFKALVTLQAIKYLVRIIKKYGVKKIWISTPRIYPLFIVYIIKFLNIYKDFEVILEYRDQWSLNEINNFSRIKRYILFNIEKILIRHVNRFIFATDLVKVAYLKNFGYINKRISSGLVMYMGFNPNYYKYNSLVKNNLKSKGKLIFTYAGSFYKTRNPLFFLRVISELISKNKINHDDISIKFILNYCAKKIYDSIIKILEEKNINKNIEIIRSVSHKRVINYLNSSDILLLIMHKEGSRDALPGKFPEYVGAKKNILAISDDPLVEKAIESDKLGWVCNYGDESDLSDIICEIYKRWEEGSLKFAGDTKKYSINKRFRELNSFLLK
jgi:hypothetical protein